MVAIEILQPGPEWDQLSFLDLAEVSKASGGASMERPSKLLIWRGRVAAPPLASSRARTLWSKCAARLLDRAGIARPQRVPIKTRAHRGVVVATADFSTSIHCFVRRCSRISQ